MSSLPSEASLDWLDVLRRFSERHHAISEIMETRFKPALVAAPQGMGGGDSTPAQLAALTWHVIKVRLWLGECE